MKTFKKARFLKTSRWTIASFLVIAFLLLAYAPFGAQKRVNAADGDSRFNAVSLTNDTLVTGNLKEDDVFYYKINKDQPGPMEMSFAYTAPAENSPSYFKVAMMDQAGTELYDFTPHSVTAGNFSTGSEIGLPAGTYYFMIMCNEGTGMDYQFKATYKNSSVWELEPNDTIAQATSLEFDKTYSGKLVNYVDSDKDPHSDIDYFRFNITATSEISLTCSHTVNTTSSDNGLVWWKIYLLNANEEYVYENPWQLRGADESTGQTMSLPAGQYYIKIRPGELYSSSRYKLTIKNNSLPTPTPKPTKTPAPTKTPKPSPTPTPVITPSPALHEDTLPKVPGIRAKAKRGRKIKVTWKKVQNAEYYVVECAKNRSFTKGYKDYKAFGNSFTIKGLKKKKKYFVRVFAASENTVQVGNDSYIYYPGPYSKVKRVKVKK